MIAGACNVWRNEPLGYPCQSDGQCASGTCNGYFCTRSCFSNADCSGSNWCLRTKADTYRCFPECNSDANCALLGAGVKCYPGVATISGFKTNVCSP